MTLTVSLNTTQLYFQLNFAKVADMLGWLSRTVYKICHNKDWKLLAADLKTKMDIWEFAGEWRRENKTHVHVTHNKHTLIWSHTDTHSSLQPQNHLSTFKCFGPAHTETSQQLPLVRSQQSCCYSFSYLFRWAEGWPCVSTAETLLKFLLLLQGGGSLPAVTDVTWNTTWLSGWPRPSYTAAFKACGRDNAEGTSWFPLEEVEDVRQKSGSGFQTRGNNRYGDVTDIQVEHVQSNFLAYILFVLLLVIQYFDTVVLLLLE